MAMSSFLLKSVCLISLGLSFLEKCFQGPLETKRGREIVRNCSQYASAHLESADGAWAKHARERLGRHGARHDTACSTLET